MNDTVRLGLLLKKIKILLNLGKYNTAMHLLDEVESMLTLLLKNKRVLLYMEEEYKLLTYYYQSFLDLKSEYYFLSNDQHNESRRYMLEMLRYGGIYNVHNRIKAFQRLIDIIQTNKRKTKKDQSSISYLNRLITFTRNERRSFVFLIDNTEDCIDYIDCIQTTFKTVVSSWLN